MGRFGNGAVMKFIPDMIYKIENASYAWEILAKYISIERGHHKFLVVKQEFAPAHCAFDNQEFYTPSLNFSNKDEFTLTMIGEREDFPEYFL